MMDPLSVTAGVVAVTTLECQCCKAAYDLIDRLDEAPIVIARYIFFLLKLERL